MTCPAGQPQGWDFGSGFSLLGPCLSTLSEVTLQGLWTALWSFLSRNGFCQGVRGLLESSIWASLSQTLPGGTVGSAWGTVLWDEEPLVTRSQASSSRAQDSPFLPRPFTTLLLGSLKWNQPAHCLLAA